jgi:hypothetical protein
VPLLVLVMADMDIAQTRTVFGEESAGLQAHRALLDWHDGEVFWSRIMRKAEC